MLDISEKRWHNRVKDEEEDSSLQILQQERERRGWKRSCEECSVNTTLELHMKKGRAFLNTAAHLA